MTRYVLGFIFNGNLTKVLLIHKTHGPNNQVDRWNGVGGKAQDMELYEEAMIREAREETGLDIPPASSKLAGAWARFATLNGFGYQIACFYAHVDDDVFDQHKSLTEEVVEAWSVYPIVLAGTLALVDGVTWLVEMARAHARSRMGIGGDDSVYVINRSR